VPGSLSRTARVGRASRAKRACGAGAGVKAAMLASALLLAGSAVPAGVETSGKQSVDPGEVPPAIHDLISARSPGFRAEAAEYEFRNGRLYYDVEGVAADGLEVEFDITEVEGRWAIVETQRDIALSAAPAAVRESLAAAFPEFSPRRIIESDQGDGVVIYEFFGPSNEGAETKIEVRYEAGQAEVLDEEWVH
jgi:hypothetical protein